MSLDAPGGRKRRVSPLLGVLLFTLALALPARAAAQITLDGSLGPAGALAGPNYAIGAGLGQTRGSNLFHSFGQFNLRTINGTRETATFSGPAVIQNIIGRVTGGSASMIDGRVRSTINGANLFLLNPAGVIFGPNAVLDVRGSFHTSTADALHFADGAQFSARLGSASALTVAPPVAFGFAGASPAPIRILGGELVVPDGQSLSLVGGDVQASGAFLGALGGRINLVAVGSPGVVRLSDGIASPEGFARMGAIDVLGSAIDVSGARGGTVTIRADSVAVDGSVVFADTLGNADGAPLGIDVAAAGEVRITGGSQVTTDVFGAGRAGAIAISAGRVVVDGDALVRSEPQPGTTGAGGALAVTAGQLNVAGATLSTRTRGAGAGGDIRIAAQGATLDEGFVIGGTRGSGAAGAITVDAGRLTLANGAGIVGDTDAGSTGAGGALTVRASEAIVMAGRGSDGSTSGILNNTRGAGDGGPIAVATPDLTMRDAATIEASTGGPGRAGTVQVDVGRLSLEAGAALLSVSLSDGNAGSVTVRASERVAIAGRSPEGLFSEIQSSADGAGDAGSVTIVTPELTMADGGSIQAASRGGGRAGDIRIETARLTLQSGAQILSLTSGDGAAGSITIAASERVTIASADGEFPSGVSSSSLRGGRGGPIAIATPVLHLDGGVIGANTTAQGDGGSIALDVGTLVASGDSEITAITAGSGRGGSVQIRAAESVTLAGEAILLVSTYGTGAAGDVSIAAPALLMDHASLRADSVAEGRAGNVVLVVGGLTLARGAQISTTARSRGAGGTITVNASSHVSISGVRDPERVGPAVSGHVSSGLPTSTAGESAAGRIVVRAPVLELSDLGAIAAQSLGSGAAGDVSIEVGRLTIVSGGFLDATALGAGRGGTIAVNASEAVSVVGRHPVATTPSQITSTTRGAGQGGQVVISAPVVELDGGAFVGTQAAGAGRAGEVRLDVGRLSVAGGSLIEAGTIDAGAGGSVTVLARESVSITGGLPGVGPSRVSALASGTGAAGQVVVSTPVLVVAGGVIGTTTEGAGNAGSVDVRADTVTLTGGASVDSSTTGAGRGGDVRIDAGAAVMVDGSRISTSASAGGAGGNVLVSAPRIALNGAQVAATSSDTGDAGTITLLAPIELVSRDSAITTSAAFADGGNIVLQVGTLIHLVDSQVVAEVGSGQGSGGNITTIDPQFLILDRSRISANAFGGPGGNVRITAGTFLRSPDSTVTASSALGQPGTVDVSSQITDLKSQVARLPEGVLQAAALLRESCAARFYAGAPSSLEVTGREVVPREPGQPLGSPLVAVAASADRAAAHAGATHTSIRLPVLLLRCGGTVAR